MKLRSNIIWHGLIIMTIVILVFLLLPDKDEPRVLVDDIDIPVDTTFTSKKEKGYFKRVQEKTKTVEPAVVTEIPEEDTENVPDNFTRIEINAMTGYLQLRKDTVVFAYPIELPFRGGYRAQISTDDKLEITTDRFGTCPDFDSFGKESGI